MGQSSKLLQTLTMSPRNSCLAILINEDLEMQRQRKHGLCSVAGSELPFSFYNSDFASQRASLAGGSGTGAHRSMKALLSC